MSVKQMGLVWEYKLSHSEAWVLMAYADHADHEGAGIRPSVDLMAWKTGYNRRQIQRITRTLVEKGYLDVVADARQHRATEYRIRADRIPRKDPLRDDPMSPLDPQGRQNVTPEPRQGRQNVTPGPARGGKMSPLIADARGGKMSPLSPQGWQNVTPEPARGDILPPEGGGGGSESHERTSTTTTPLPPTDPAAPVAPAGGGGGENDPAIVHQESYTLLVQLGVRRTNARQLAAHPPNRVRAQIAAARENPTVRDHAAWVASALAAIDPDSDPESALNGGTHGPGPQPLGPRGGRGRRMVAEAAIPAPSNRPARDFTDAELDAIAEEAAAEHRARWGR